MMKGQLQTVEQQRLFQSPPPASLTQKQQEEIDRLILAYKRQMEGVEIDKQNLGEENRALRLNLHEQQETNKRLEAQISQLLEQMRMQQRGNSGMDQKEQIHALEMQMKVYSEDFAQEKADRQRWQAKAEHLEIELSAHKVQMESLQRAAMSRVNQHRFGARPNVPLVQCDDPTDLDDVSLPQQSQLPLHLISRNFDDEMSEGEDEIDMPMAMAPRKLHKHVK